MFGHDGERYDDPCRYRQTRHVARRTSSRAGLFCNSCDRVDRVRKMSADRFNICHNGLCGSERRAAFGQTAARFGQMLANLWSTADGGGRRPDITLEMPAGIRFEHFWGDFAVSAWRRGE